MFGFGSLPNPFSFFLLIFILIPHNSQADGFDSILTIKSKQKLIHSIGFSYTNGIYLPQKVYENEGLVYQTPTTKYGYEVGLSYNLIFFRGLGFTTDFVLGGIPTGTNYKNKKPFPDDYVWPNSFRSDPIQGSFSNGPNLTYSGFNFKFNYLFSVSKHLGLQPEIGAKAIYIVSSSQSKEYSFCDSTVNNCVNYLYSYAENEGNVNNNQNYKVRRKFYPDLLIGVNFFIYPKNPMHTIKIGLNFNYGFAPRMEGYYEVYNLGAEYNSSGKMQFGSTHFGITVGYQFFSKGIKQFVEKKNVRKE